MKSDNNQPFSEKIKEFFGFKEEDPTPLIEEKFTPTPQKPISKVFKGSLINTKNAKYFSHSEIKIEEPRIYEDSLSIASHLRNNTPVIVNLKYLESDSGKRLIDFICGTAYAINGHMVKIGENIFLFTPANMQIDATHEKTTLEEGIEQEEKEVFFRQVSNF